MTMNNPNILKDMSVCIYSFFACVSLPYRICFVKGKRVSREEYDYFTHNYEQEKTKKEI